jgi:hypothetical protein
MEGFKYRYWAFEKLWNAVKEIISSVMLGNVLRKSHKNGSFLNAVLQTVWPDGVKFDSMLVLVTNVASYMK